MKAEDTPAPATFVYDGDCGFCTRCAQFAERRIATTARIVPWQRADLAASADRGRGRGRAVGDSEASALAGPTRSRPCWPAAPWADERWAGCWGGPGPGGGVAGVLVGGAHRTGCRVVPPPVSYPAPSDPVPEPAADQRSRPDRRGTRPSRRCAHTSGRPAQRQEAGHATRWGMNEMVMVANAPGGTGRRSPPSRTASVLAG